MIDSGLYNTLLQQTQTANILRNAYRVHDKLEAELRKYGELDFTPPNPVSVKVEDFLTEPAMIACAQSLTDILNRAGWTLTYTFVPTNQVSRGEVVQKVEFVMSQ